MAERLVEAVERDAEKPPLERWNALIARGAIDAKGRVLLKAPRPMNAARSNPPKSKKPK
jgi:hypothetical protein